MATIKAYCIVYIPLALGVCIFGLLGIFIEIYLILGADVAFDWVSKFNLKYPEEMLLCSGYRAYGNYIGILVGVAFGWWFGKYILVGRFKLMEMEEVKRALRHDKKR